MSSSPAALSRRPRSRSRSASPAARPRRWPPGDRVGSLEIESFEPEFSFDADGAVTGARSVPQTEAHKLIEHLMILTNERVARLLEQRGVPTLYRVHEQPEPQRIELLVEQLAALEVPTPPLPELLSPSAGRRARR